MRADGERTRLVEVKVDTWGGWIWINMDPDCEPLRDYLEPAASHLDQFELDKMRYRWRKWVVFECNWKVAIEAFAESYHVKVTHPQLNKYGDFYTVSSAQGLHGNNKFHSKKPEENNTATATVSRAAKGADARKTIAQMQQEFWETMEATPRRPSSRPRSGSSMSCPKGLRPKRFIATGWICTTRRRGARAHLADPRPGEGRRGGIGLADFP